MENKTVYFGGAGYCAAIYVGVVKGLREIFPEEKPIIHADSAGAVVALAYAIDVPNEMMKKLLWDMTVAQQKTGYRYGIRTRCLDDIRKTIRSILKHGDFSIIQNNAKFSVGITSFFNKYTVYTNWQTTDELENVLLKSAHIPLLQNKIYPSMELDGAYASRSTAYDITIGQSDGYHISIPTTWIEKITIATSEETKKMIDLGYHRTKDFFLQKDRASKKRISESGFFLLAFMWFLKFLSLLMYIFD